MAAEDLSVQPSADSVLPLEEALERADNRRHQADYKVGNRINQAIDEILIGGAGDLARSSYRRGRLPEARGRCLGFRCVGFVEDLPR